MVGLRSQAQNAVVTDAVGAYPAGIALNPATNTIYVTNYDSNTASVINGAKNTVIAAIPVGNHPQAIAVNPTTDTVHGGNGVWMLVSPAGTGNPAKFTITPPFKQVGLNTLYVYAAYGSEGTSAGASNQTGNSPEIGNITALNT